jgi:hypothetical protein
MRIVPITIRPIADPVMKLHANRPGLERRAGQPAIRALRRWLSHLSRLSRLSLHHWHGISYLFDFYAFLWKNDVQITAAPRCS